MISEWKWINERRIRSSSISEALLNTKKSISVVRSIFLVSQMIQMLPLRKLALSPHSKNFRRINALSFIAIRTTVCSRNMSDSCSRKKESTFMSSISDGMSGATNGISGMGKELRKPFASRTISKERQSKKWERVR